MVNLKDIVDLNINLALFEISAIPLNILLSIWMINHYKYKNKDYHCYINGQTGKATGKSLFEWAT